jgi:AmmeMemoRadiSam system protein B
MRAKKIRSPVASGFLYPEERGELLDSLNAFNLYQINQDNDASAGEARALIVPHGAWNISGAAAAAAFTACLARKESIKRVVLMGAVHDPAQAGVAFSTSDSFDTPLGEIQVDSKVCEELASCSTLFELNDHPHLREFSLEVLLPFVKYCLPGARIVPVLMGKTVPGLIKALAGALHVVFAGDWKNTLFVISTCLSKNGDKDAAISQAKFFTGLLAKGDGEEIEKARAEGKTSACGDLLAAAFLESGLAKGLSCRKLQKALGESDCGCGYVCFGSLGFF